MPQYAVLYVDGPVRPHCTLGKAACGQHVMAQQCPSLSFDAYGHLLQLTAQTAVEKLATVLPVDTRCHTPLSAHVRWEKRLWLC